MGGDQEALRVFISYARRDASDFAEELLAGLEVAGFNAFLDRHDIAAGEEWEARLESLIQSADTIVFVMTPASVGSERCQWEIDKAEALGKRIIPCVRIASPEDQTPERLRKLNYIFFTEGRSFSRSLADLATALRIDLGWIREHTRLADQARRWQDREGNPLLLLRGGELEAARTWLTTWRAPAPEPTDLHRAFLGASEAAESDVIRRERARQRRALLVVSLVAVLLAALAGVSGYFWLRAAESEKLALHNEQIAKEMADAANASAEQAKYRAARASFYEGLYWFRVARDRTGTWPLRRSYWEKASKSFDAGLGSLGDLQVDEDGYNLRHLIEYGRAYITACLGTSAVAGLTSAELEKARTFYQQVLLPECG
jgi:hypothetical protein